MGDVQHLQFAAPTHPIGDTSQLVPLIKQTQSAPSLEQAHIKQGRLVFKESSYQDKSRTVRFSGTGCTSSSCSSKNTKYSSSQSERMLRVRERHLFNIYMTHLNICTIVCSVQAFEGVATDSEVRQSVSVTAEELQATERPDIQLL